MEDKETKAYYEKIFLDAFDEISSAEKQEKTWGNVHYKGYNTFGEVCNEFMSSCEDVKKWQHFSPEQKEKLCKVFDLLDHYKFRKQVGSRKVCKADKEIYEDPAWQEIRAFAREVYDEIIKIPI